MDLSPWIDKNSSYAQQEPEPCSHRTEQVAEKVGYKQRAYQGNRQYVPLNPNAIQWKEHGKRFIGSQGRVPGNQNDHDTDP